MQADYYTSSNWLTEEEKIEAEKKEKLRVDSKKRINKSINIAIDVTQRSLLLSYSTIIICHLILLFNGNSEKLLKRMKFFQTIFLNKIFMNKI